MLLSSNAAGNLLFAARALSRTLRVATRMLRISATWCRPAPGPVLGLEGDHKVRGVCPDGDEIVFVAS